MENEDKGTSIYLPSIEVRNTLRILAKHHKRSMDQHAEKLILDDWYRLPASVRDELINPAEYAGEGVS